MENFSAKDFPYRNSPMLLRHNTLQHFRSKSAEHGSSEHSSSVIHRSTPPSNRRRIKSDPGGSLRRSNNGNSSASSQSTRPKRASSFTENRERHIDKSKAGLRSRSVSASYALGETRNQSDTVRTVSKSVECHHHHHHLPYQEDSDSTRGVVDKWRRILFKQISDSAILQYRRRPRMTQEIQQMENISPLDQRQSGERRSGDEGENSPARTTPKAKALKHLQHPRKKFIRTQSESAIDVNNIRNRKTSHLGSPDLKGIVCTNDDLKKIIMDARRGNFSRQRNNTITSPSKFEVLPELTETSIDSRINGRRRSPPHDLNVMWSRGPRRQHSIDITDSPSRYTPKCDRPRSRKSSPKASPIAKRTVIEPSCPHVATSASSSTGTCERCREERTGMLQEEDEEEEEVSCPLLDVNKKVTQPLEEKVKSPDEESPLAGLAASLGGLDPQLLGEAIERRLAIAERTPPQKKSPTKTPEGKGSPQLFRAIWGQNNTQLSNRLGNLVAKFPFKKEVGQPGTSGISV